MENAVQVILDHVRKGHRVRSRMCSSGQVRYKIEYGPMRLLKKRYTVDHKEADLIERSIETMLLQPSH